MTWLLGCSSGNVLLVDVQTNVRSADFDAVEVEFSSGSTTVTSSPLPASAVAADLSSTRVAEFAGLPSGVGRVVVRFVRDGGVVAVGQAEFALNGPALVTVVVAQECNGVTCPGEGRVCVGGRCADPRCTPESAEFCPAPLGEEAADCPAAADCNSNVCVVGACVSTFGGICDAGTADAGSPDAGPPAAGPPPESRPADSRAC
ncbi:MAG: hypothetical protein AB8I08_35730, partial [Sandaracinaceae bacterium]